MMRTTNILAFNLCLLAALAWSLDSRAQATDQTHESIVAKINITDKNGNKCIDLHEMDQALDAYGQEFLPGEFERREVERVEAKAKEYPSADTPGVPTATGNLSLVDRTGLPDLLSAAIEGNFLNLSEDSKLGFSLNLLDTKSAKLSPKERWRRYADPEHGPFHQLKLAVTAGGKGDKFDRDGDGKADEPLQAKEPGEIIAWELHWEITGNQQRADTAEAFLARAFTETEARVKDKTQKTIADLFKDPDISKGIADASRADQCVSEGEFRNILRQAKNLPELLSSAVAAEEAYLDDVEKLATEFQKKWRFAVTGGKTHRQEDFGPDFWTAKFIGSKDFSDRSKFTFNVAWSQRESDNSLPEPTTWKGALEVATKFAPTSWLGNSELGFSTSYERFEDVLDAKHDEIIKVGPMLTLPLSGGAKVPISVTWANHADVLTDRDVVTGQIGIAFSLDKPKS